LDIRDAFEVRGSGYGSSAQCFTSADGQAPRPVDPLD